MEYPARTCPGCKRTEDDREKLFRKVPRLVRSCRPGYDPQRLLECRQCGELVYEPKEAAK